MPRTKKYTDIDYNRLVNLLNSGLGYREIILILRIKSISTLHRIIKNAKKKGIIIDSPELRWGMGAK